MPHGSISSLSAKISVSSQLEFISFTTASIWQGGESNKTINLYTADNKIGNFNIGAINVKVKNDANSVGEESVLIYDVKFYDNNFSEITVSNSSSNIKLTSINNYLASLSISSGTLSPSFDKNVTNYSASVSVDNVIINALTEDNKATISGIGNKKLDIGENNYKIVVTSEYGSTREYNLSITRIKTEAEKKDNSSNSNNNKKTINPNSDETKTLSTNNKLKSLKVTGYDIKFLENTYDYSIDIDSDIDKVEVIAVPQDNKAKVIIETEFYSKFPF